MLSLRSKFILNYIFVGLTIVVLAGLTALIGIKRVREIALKNYDKNNSALVAIQKVINSYENKAKILKNITRDNKEHFRKLFWEIDTDFTGNYSEAKELPCV